MVILPQEYRSTWWCGNKSHFFLHFLCALKKTSYICKVNE